MIAHVPNDVEWQPSSADGRVLRGSDQLLAYWEGADPTPAAISAWFEAIDDDVMIETEHELEDGSRKLINSLYMFSGPRLVRAIAVLAVAVGEPHP